MGRMLRVLVLAAALLALAPVPASAVAGPPGTVVVVLVPYLTWDDIAAGRAPAIARLADDGAVACVSVRAVSTDPVVSVARSARVISAGRPVSSEATAGIGALGQALSEAGVLTAALGSSAPSRAGVGALEWSPAVLVAGDGVGRVGYLRVIDSPLREDPESPSGVVTDLTALDRAYRDVLSGARTAGRPAFIVLDSGDAARARAAAELETAQWEDARIRALASSDAVARMAVRSLPPGGVVIVASTAQAADRDGVAGLGPLVAYGLGPGVLTSASTRRSGLVTLPDVGATALAVLGVERPPSYAGAPLVAAAASSAPGAERIAAMASLDRAMRALEGPRQHVWFGFIAVAALGVLGALVAAARGLAPAAPLARVLVAITTVAFTVPAASLLMMLGKPPGSPAEVLARFGALTALGGGAALLGARRWGSRTALGWVCAITGALVVFDGLAGAPLAFGSLFSYSPVFGARFFGIGNEGAAIALGASLAAVGLLSRGADGRAASYRFLAAGLAVSTVMAIPPLGANVGVAVWGVAGTLAAFLAARKGRLRWVHVALGAGCASALLAGAFLLERLIGRPSHLGALVDAVVAEGAAPLIEIIERKIALNIEILSATPVVVLLPLALAALAWLLARPSGPLGAVLIADAALAAALLGVLVAAVAGALTEDSGVAVSALVGMYGAGALGAIALSRDREGVTPDD